MFAMAIYIRIYEIYLHIIKNNANIDLLKQNIIS